MSADAPTDAEATEAEGDAPEEEAAPATDDVRDGVIAELCEALGDAVLDTHVDPGHDMWARIDPAAWEQAGLALRDELGFRYFCFLSAIDWKPAPWGRGEEDPTEPPPERPTAVEQGVAGGDTRFQVLARVVKVPEGIGINLKVDVGDAMTLPTWTGVYAGADWHERETWEMFGISFAGHPNLRHLYLPGDFEGNPLRKDYPLLARHVKPWPGIVDVEPMPPEPERLGAEGAESGDAEPEPEETTDESADAPAEEQAARSDSEGQRDTEADGGATEADEAATDEETS